MNKMLFWKNEHIFVENLLKCNFSNHLIIYCIHACPPTLSVRDFSRSFRFSQVFIVIIAYKKKPLVSRIHPPGICHSRSLCLLPKIFFRELKKTYVFFFLDLRFCLLIFCRGSNIQTDCEGISDLYFLLL